ncbi:hypothetical protein M595_1971 [Lyngbya aestuarii BL J]|uniref:Uncharacterized protein n=1 Tax=Lyngbya aestuarii BL J TaxID=1348334 RepID=U7QJ75_9CYAN|nr:hypothetical protein M595_1971 [Lyngbya aestuarii BL J]
MLLSENSRIARLSSKINRNVFVTIEQLDVTLKKQDNRKAYRLKLI